MRRSGLLTMTMMVATTKSAGAATRTAMAVLVVMPAIRARVARSINSCGCAAKKTRCSVPRRAYGRYQGSYPAVFVPIGRAANIDPRRIAKRQ